MEYTVENNERFPKIERISSKKLIEELFQNGKSFFQYPFKIYFLPSQPCISPYPQVLISVPKKHFKKAVDRNLLKRRIREAYRKNKNILKAPENNPLKIAFILVSKEIISYKEIELKIIKVLKRISAEM